MKITRVSTTDLIDFSFTAIDDRGFIWTHNSSRLFDLNSIIGCSEAIRIIFKLMDVKTLADTKDFKFVLSNDNIVGLYIENEGTNTIQEDGYVITIDGKPLPINNVPNAEIVTEISLNL